jgi:hypothetical protein
MAASSQEDPFNYRPLKRTKLSLKRTRQIKQSKPTRTQPIPAEDSRQRKLIAVGQQSSAGQNSRPGPPPKQLRLQGWLSSVFNTYQGDGNFYLLSVYKYIIKKISQGDVNKNLGKLKEYQKY